MKNFWNNDQHTFQQLPKEGKFEFKNFFLAALFISTMFVGIGQLPFTFAVMADHTNLSGDTADILFTLSNSIGKNKLLTLLLIPFVVTFGALLFSFKYFHRSKILSFFTSRIHFDWKRSLLSFGIWFSILSIMLVYYINTSDAFMWNYNSSSIVGLVAISILIIPIQIACEELIFRSYLFKALSFMKRPILQLVICGTLFGLMHLNNPEIGKLGTVAILFYIWTGIFLGLMTHFDNGLELSLGYHAANNIFGALIVTTNWQAFQTDALWLDNSPPSMGWDILLTLFLWQPLMFYYFNKKFNWGIGSK